MISSVTFVTADRPDLLERSLKSYRDHCLRHGREVTFLVMDDSASTAARTQYLDRLKLEKHHLIRYSGRKEKLGFIDYLAQQGIDRSIASFAVLGSLGTSTCTTGANRNCALLDTLGEMILFADDDTVCKLVPHPERDKTLKLGNHENPRDVQFFATRLGAITAIQEIDCDLLGEHERLLGRSLPEILAETPPNLVDSDEGCKHLLASTAQTDAKVLVTMSGVAGDSGAGSAQRFLLSSRRALEILNSSEAVTRLAFASREVLWVARSCTITHSSHCAAAGLGVANQNYIPPFFPAGRNQDGVFGVLNLLTPNYLLGHLPIAICHDPAQEGKYPSLPVLGIASHIISLIHYAQHGRPTSLAKSLPFIGRKLQEIACLEEREFWHVLFAAVSENQALTVRSLDRIASTGTWNNLVQQEIERYRKHILNWLRTSGCSIPSEFSALDYDLARAETRRLVQKAGDLFCAWSQLVEASRYLQAKGIRLSRSVLDVDD